MRRLYKFRTKRRIIALFAILCFLLATLSVKLVWIQGFKSMEYADKQAQMLMQRLPITASRGDIYDRNMNLLAKDATSQSIYVRPVDVDQSKAKEISRFLSKQLKLSYKSVYKKVTNVNSTNELLKRKVDNNVAMKIRKKNYRGIEFAEDKKRYYTNGKFASYVLGFTGADHQGLYGIEASFDDVLSGTDGVTIFETDGRGRTIASGTKIRQEAVSGNNVVLTIDSVIQMYAENALQTGLKKTKGKRVMAIAVNPKTGEVLAMASNPSYNLNDPWELDSSFKSKFSSDFYKINKKGKEVRMNESEKLFVQWENPLVSFNYEPGSTFKPITVSSALEEGSITRDTRFYCSGSRNVAGTKIRCHVYPNAHGSESLGDTLANSCNPAMIEISTRMGPDVFYNYIYNFGYGAKTGIQLPGEESGIVPANENVNVVDFVTKSFGQAISTTPTQMIMALSSIVNGGYLLKPQVVKYVTEGDDNKIVNTYDREVVRQVISKNTSTTLRKYLRGVVTKSQVISKYASKSAKMGGKTGTAQKIVDGRYSNSKYVCSFFGFAPYNNPQIAVLVLVDEPQNDTTGSASAGPIANEIIKNSVNYLKTKSNENKKTTKTLKSKVIVPDLRGYSKDEAVELLNTLGIKYKIKYMAKDTKNGYVLDQNYKQKDYTKTVTLTIGPKSDKKDGKVTVPNVKGLSVQSANQTLQNAGLKIKVEGGGIAYSQSVRAGKKVKRGKVITVKFKYIE